MSTKETGQITRSPGVVVHPGYVVGGGLRGFTKELDEAVEKAAEALRDHFGMDVTIRFNSNRMSGGAWLVDSDRNTISSNSSIGLSAALVNSKLRAMSCTEAFNLPKEDYDRMAHEPDTVVYTTAIDLTKTVHSVSPDSKHILINTEYRDFNSLTEASEYLFSHVVGLKHPCVKK